MKMKYLHDKGFVALDGASLTIAAIDNEGGRIKVTLIPETIGTGGYIGAFIAVFGVVLVIAKK